MRATSWGSLCISLGGRRAQSVQQLPGSNGRSVRVGIVPLFQVYPVFVPLFSLHRSFPGLIGLLGVLPVGMLARILIWFLFAHGIAPQRAERNCSSTGPARS